MRRNDDPCKFRKLLKNASTLAIVAVNTEENEPKVEVRNKSIPQISYSGPRNIQVGSLSCSRLRSLLPCPAVAGPDDEHGEQATNDVPFGEFPDHVDALCSSFTARERISAHKGGFVCTETVLSIKDH